MANGRDDTPQSGRHHSKRYLANQERLLALGDAVEGKGDVKRRPKGRRRVGRRIAIGAGIVVLLVAAVAGGSYYYANYRFNKITKINVIGEQKAISGKPFNILMIGSDSRAGLTGLLARQTGASTDSVDGQRSDSVKIIHVDPSAGTINMISIPRDTVVSLLANQSLYGQFNRINVNFGSGPSLLAQTITANFGIPINQTVVVSFAGLVNAADALGGVYLDFRYPSWDPYSGLRVLHPGCQLITGFQTLAVSRSRHFYYNVDHAKTFPPDSWGSTSEGANELYDAGWMYDPTSDFGRIDRQDAFMRAMISRAKTLYNPLTLNSFLSKIPQGVALDRNFTLHELIGLAVRFHGINPNSIQTWTLPTLAVNNTALGDVLYVQQPETQQMLVDVFGSQLETPSNPPPNQAGQTPLPPVVTATTTTTAPTTTTTSKSGGTTTTTTKVATPNPTLTSVPDYDPVPCTPK